MSVCLCVCLCLSDYKHFTFLHLRQVGVVGRVLWSGVSQLSIADRATISNMCPEYGATVGFFAVDDMNMKYLKQTGEYL